MEPAVTIVQRYSSAARDSSTKAGAPNSTHAKSVNWQMMYGVLKLFNINLSNKTLETTRFTPWKTRISLKALDLSETSKYFWRLRINVNIQSDRESLLLMKIPTFV